MKFSRSSGILLHPTSLPSPYGIGDLGPSAYEWIDFLVQSRCGLWQILPLGPTGYGDSPYQCFSAFGGNIYLISPELLKREGLLKDSDFDDMPNFPSHIVDYGSVIPWKISLLHKAYKRFVNSPPPHIKAAYELFCNENSYWLDDFSLFMALKEAHLGEPWFKWEKPLRQRTKRAIIEARDKYRDEMQRQTFFQFLFFYQWQQLYAYAKEKKIKIIGDIPIFMAHDSVEVWANPELFYLDKDGMPTVVAGVPPDYFSPSGQLWGNPLYRWEVHEASGFEWWVRRVRAVLSAVDIVRLDHFRGFAAYWEVPAYENDAINGRWVPAPGESLLKTIARELGDLPIIAEDLGVITPDVVQLRQKFGLPGMKILVFAFDDGPEDVDLPHHYTEDCVVYTGTHDNDTIRGWYDRVSEKERDFARRYLRTDGHDISWDVIRAAWASVAVFSLTTMQDLLSLGNDGRMNYPSRPSGNWVWRMPAYALNELISFRMAELNWLYSRVNE